MGRPVKPPLSADRTTGLVRNVFVCAAAALGLLCAVATAEAQTAKPAPAATPATTPAPAKPSAEKPKDRLLVEAKEIVYDKDKNTVAAVGNAQLYYQGRTLEADKVTYDRNTNRVFAAGNAKLTDENGNVTYADSFELTDNFRDGFIDTLRLDTKDKTHFTSPRGERTEGETAVFQKATYTACEPCKEHPEKPPLWQVRARRIIHNNEEHLIYFEQATLELYGWPIAYIPYFSAPDPSVTRQTGILVPHYINKTKLGNGLAVPFFWNIAPNYDLTLTPTYFSRQGLFGEAQWRHRLMNGSYYIRASGISEQDKAAFPLTPSGAGNIAGRGSIESAGKFYLSSKWTFGWDVARMSDRFFFTDYHVPSESISLNYFRESISTVYLTGKGERGYFDLRGYQIQAQLATDNQRQQPLVLPVLDYNKTIDVPKDRTGGLGGEITVDLNLTSLSRRDAAYQSTGRRTVDQVFGLYDVCETGVSTALRTRSYNPASCLLRGIGGDYTRLSGQVSYQRKFIDPIGQVWTPFAFLRGDIASVNPNASSGTYLTSAVFNNVISNADQSNFLGYSSQQTIGRAMPGVGLEYRYPFIASTSWGSHVIEPIAQVIARPSNNSTKRLPNEDSQSLVFDDTTVFEWNKFSGYDRLESGTRANVGAQYSFTSSTGAYVNALAAQSFQLAGRNSFSLYDVANTGVNSGLDKRRSDYVTRFSFAPVGNINFIAKGRFDNENFDMKRLDLIASGYYGRVSTSVQYARYLAQPEIGFPKRREGILSSSALKLTDQWYATGSVLVDLTRYLYDVAPQKTSVFSPTAFSVGLGYKDECTTMTVSFISGLTDNGTGNKTRSQTVLFRLELRTLGEIKSKTGIGQIKVQDALSAAVTATP